MDLTLAVLVTLLNAFVATHAPAKQSKLFFFSGYRENVLNRMSNVKFQAGIFQSVCTKYSLTLMESTFVTCYNFHGFMFDTDSHRNLFYFNQITKAHIDVMACVGI